MKTNKRLIAIRSLLFTLVLSLTFVMSGFTNASATTNSAYIPGGKNYIELDNMYFDGEFLRTDDDIAVLSSTTYTLSFDFQADVDFGIIFGHDSDYMDYDSFTNDGTRSYYTFTTSANESFISISLFGPDLGQELYYNGVDNIQLEIGSSYTAFETYQEPVIDVDPPLISGASAIHYRNINDPITQANFLATLTVNDLVDGDVTNTLTVESSNYLGNENTVGNYTIEVSAHDYSNNYVYVTFEIRVVDTTKPVINVSFLEAYIEYGDSYTRPTVSIVDNYDPTRSNAVITGSVEEAVLGDYYEYYNASDTSGNAADEVMVTYHIVDTTAPVQTLNGNSTVYIEFGSNYTELGTSVYDNYDGSSLNSTISGSVNVGVLGTYVLTYNVTDTNGNTAAPLSRTVIVRDTTAPTVTGDITHLTYTDFPSPLQSLLDFTFSDLHDTNLQLTIEYLNDTYTGNEQVVGTYTVDLKVTDTSGNITLKTITIDVVDNELPIFECSLTLYSVEYANSLTQEEIRALFE